MADKDITMPAGIEPEASEKRPDTRIERRRKRRQNTASTVFAVLFVVLCLAAAWFFLPNFHRVIRGDFSELKNFALLAYPEETPEPPPEPTPVNVATPEPGPTPEPEPMTGFLTTENSYLSANVSVTVETVVENNKTYYVADIIIKDMSAIQTGVFRVPDGVTKGDVVETAIQNNAIIAINTDYYTYRDSGNIIRNGEVMVNDGWGDTLCIFEDGSMDTFVGAQHDAYELQEMGVVQSFTFGPVLVEDGQIMWENLRGSGLKEARHPRAGIGYYEPGHYLFVVVDGRKEGYSIGMTVTEFAEMFAARGCELAYNLDGGGSATMAFLGQLVNRPEGRTDHLRNVDGILYIKDDIYEIAPSE